MWWSFDACASHIGITYLTYTIPENEDDPVKVTVQETNQKQMIDSYNKFETYKAMSDEVNKFHNNIISQMFDHMHWFVSEHRDQIRMCLKDKYKEAWDRTINLVIDDLANNGTKYFCAFDWKKKKKNGRMQPSYDASDNFFDPQTKKYRINDGIIGWLKQLLFKGASENQHNIFISKPKNADLTYYENGITLRGVIRKLIHQGYRTINDMAEMVLLDANWDN
jgi:hypothetical protein